MEDDPSLEFDHFLAEKLGMTVDQMRRSVDGQEYTDWYIYYARKAQRQELASKTRG